MDEIELASMDDTELWEEAWTLHFHAMIQGVVVPSPQQLYDALLALKNGDSVEPSPSLAVIGLAT